MGPSSKKYSTRRAREKSVSQHKQPSIDTDIGSNILYQVDQVRAIIKLAYAALIEDTGTFGPDSAVALELANEQLQRIRDTVDRMAIYGTNRASEAGS